MSQAGLLPSDATALAHWAPAERADLAPYFSRRAYPAGAVTLSDAGWWVVTSGRARLLDATGGQALKAGDGFGEAALARGEGPDLHLMADESIGLAHLSLPRFEALSAERPALALQLLRALWPAPPAAACGPAQAGIVRVSLAGGVAEVPEGTRLAEVLPAAVAGRPVVAALLDHKLVSLDTPLRGDAAVEALTDTHREGRAVVLRALGLLLLEAASKAFPRLRLQLGSTTGRRQAVHVENAPDLPADTLAAQLTAAMTAIVQADAPFRRETWPLEVACTRFEGQGWHDVVSLLRTWRDASVTVISCGSTFALAMGPLPPRTGMLPPFRLSAHGEGLELAFGDGLDAGAAPLVAVPRAKVGWLEVLDVHHLGGFNAACVSGQVSQLIRAAEGYHEKRIGQIADRITARAGQVRAIGIAGPSSSGKTTFIKRLTVQLQVDGLRPHAISLDDYYCDREKTPRSLDGEYDYEALEALELDLLRTHVAALLAGQAVRTARYDFKAGKSLPEGGPLIQLGPEDVLMLEGIHALNPRLLGSVMPREQMVRVFAWPATTLPFDRLSNFALTDLRLLRRIVRDRHTRGADAAANIMRWPSVRRGEDRNILPFAPEADEVFDSALVYEPAVLKVYAERYLLEVPQDHPAYPTAYRLRQLLDRFVAIYPDHVPPTSILREFIGGSGFEY